MKLSSIKNGKPLHTKIWLYLVVFVIAILSVLWISQGMFFDKYYEFNKSRELSKTADKIINSYKNNMDNFSEVLDEISYNSGICVEINVNGELYYSSTSYNRGCLMEFGKSDNTYKRDFETSGETKKAYKLINDKFNNDTLVYGIKLENNIYAYINVSLVPLDSATHLLKKQLVIISAYIVIISFIIAYFISKFISKPIEKISEKAKKWLMVIIMFHLAVIPI